MKEFDKYTMYLLKAQAVKEIGSEIECDKRTLKNNLEYYENCIAERNAELVSNGKEDEIADDWRIRDCEEYICRYNIQLALWDKIEKLLEKEMGA